MEPKVCLVCCTMVFGFMACASQPAVSERAQEGPSECALIVDVASTDGVVLSVRAVGGGEADAVVLLAINGGPGLSHHYLADLDPLASPSMRVVTYGQRGLGGSIAPAGAKYDNEAQIADIEAIRTHFEAESMIVLGHSWGGYLAMVYAASHPDRVSHLVLAASVSAYDAPMQAGMTWRKTRIEALQTSGHIPFDTPSASCERFRAILPAYFHYPEFALTEALAEMECDAEVADAIRAAIYSVEANDDLRPSLAEFDESVTILTGESDFLGGEVAASLVSTLR